MSQGEPYRTELNKAMDLGEKKPKQALKMFARIVDLYPDAMQPRFERAMVLLNLDRDEEAIAELEHVLRVEPMYPGARDWHARVVGAHGKYLQAAELMLADLLETKPDHWSANGQKWADCAGHFLRAGAADRALAALDVYFERYEGQQRGYKVYLSAPYRARAKALLTTGRPDEALAAIESACACEGSVPADQFVRVQALAALGRVEEARAAFASMQVKYAGTDGIAETLSFSRTIGVELE
jgi:predicted Zn-dependent protease